MGLTLKRKEGEEIMIGDDIMIRVNYIIGKQCSLDITAPREIKVDRKEIYDARKRGPKRTQALREQRGAAGSGGNNNHRAI